MQTKITEADELSKGERAETGSGTMVHVYNPRARKAEVEHGKLEVNLGYTVRPCTKTKNNVQRET